MPDFNDSDVVVAKKSIRGNRGIFQLGPENLKIDVKSSSNKDMIFKWLT